MERAKVFMSGTSQAVRLTKGVSFPDDVNEVVVRKVGRERVLSPTTETWNSFFLAGEDEGVSDDFMLERASQEQDERLSFDD